MRNQPLIQLIHIRGKISRLGHFLVRIKNISPAVWGPGMFFLAGLFLPVKVTTNWSAQRCRGLRFAQGPQGKHRHGSPKFLPALEHGQPSGLGCLLCQTGCQQPRLLPDSPSHESIPLFYLYLFLTLPLSLVLPPPPSLGFSFCLVLSSLSLRMGRGSASVAVQGQPWF